MSAFVAILIGLLLSWRPLGVAGSSAVEGAYKFLNRLPATIQATIQGKKAKKTPQPPSQSQPLIIPVSPVAAPTPTNNDYTVIKNAVAGAANGDTIMLSGAFNWAETNAKASWVLGNDGVAGNIDDFCILPPANLNTITFTAASLGAATIQGPGDDPRFDGEGVLFFNSASGSKNQGWTISNIRFVDFDDAIFMNFGSGGAADAYSDTKIMNNYFLVAKDLTGPEAAAAVPGGTDDFQNIGIFVAHGKNQLISGNTIELHGDGISEVGATTFDQFSSEVGIQSTTSGFDTYDGLQITNNIVRVLNAQSVRPERIRGIWENSQDHQSDVTVSGNQFLNPAAGNNPATNLQSGFRVTAHSSTLPTTVKYQNNTVQGANIGFEWLAGQSFGGTQPVQMISNTIVNSGTGVKIDSAGSATLTFNRIAGNTIGLQNLTANAISAENNWWGCNLGPGLDGTGCAGTANAVSNTGGGSVDSDPWLVLRITAVPTMVTVGGMSTLTADLTFNSNGTDTHLSGFVPDGTPVLFSAVGGTVSPMNPTTTSGKATSTYTATTPGTGIASTTVDQQTVSTPIVNQASGGCPTTTVIVGPGNQAATGWQTLQAIFGEAPPDNGTQTYEFGPSVPPLGVGSLEFRIGATNDWDEDVGYTALNNVGLGSLTDLSYSTFIETASNFSQDFYVILLIDTNGDHAVDDFLFFFPANQQGCSDNAPAQHAIFRNQWQNWDAAKGVWVSANGFCGAENACSTANDPKTLADYLLCSPTARIINDDSGTPDPTDDTPGLIIGYGGGGTSVSTNFIGNLDNVKVGVACNMTVFDFDPCALGSCPSNITQPNTPNQCGAVVTYPVPTTNGGACGTVTCSPASGSFFPAGTTTVTCKSNNGAGPEMCMFTITVNDTQPPVITCPGSVTINTATSCPPSGSGPANFGVTATDNCGVTVVCVPASGSSFPVGTTTVTCTATDTSGNTATCSFPVNVFNGCLQDDSDPSRVVIFNAKTGEYRFCCGGTAFTGVGTVTVRGCVVTISHNPPDRRVLLTFDGSVKKGTASLQSPPGNIKCTITDRNTDNNTCNCP